MNIFNKYTEKLVKLALGEDIGKGDITTEALLIETQSGKADFIANEDFIVAGLELVDYLFKMVDPLVITHKKVKDGHRIRKGSILVAIEGDVRSLMKGERVALNFISRLSGIATLTSQYVEAVKPYGTKIMDTRKTTPGWRILEKYAVTVGGGKSHRMGLYDQILIKDNHLKLCARETRNSVKIAIDRAVRRKGKYFVEVEIDDPELVTIAKGSGADRVMLDNMTTDQMRRAIELAGGEIELEASGGVSLDNVVEIAKTGVDAISIGGLTHSAESVDISMEFRNGY
ncbi:MAG: carboxylating nicotinate-nucleotide diphosphorylase [Candidatus Aureabacteria bacterium]|nr:carboxylating nicotinate-nucleotide diphosphorylase [Candidatus Auribacterota bacterium]